MRSILSPGIELDSPRIPFEVEKIAHTVHANVAVASPGELSAHRLRPILAVAHQEGDRLQPLVERRLHLRGELASAERGVVRDELSKAAEVPVEGIACVR